MKKYSYLQVIYFVLISAISLYFKLSFVYVLLIFPLVFLRKEWILTVLLLPSILKQGMVDIDPVTGVSEFVFITIGVFTIIMLFPLILVESIKKPVSLRKVYTRYFIIWFSLIFSGILVYALRFSVFDILTENLFLVVKFFFYFFFLKFLLSKDSDFIHSSLKIITQTTIPVLVLLIVYSLTISPELFLHEQFLSFGYAKHGTYTATLTVFSIYTFYSFHNYSKNFLNKIFYGLVLVSTYYLILQMGSRNGLISFPLMLIAGFFLFTRSSSLIKKITMVVAGVILIGTVVFFNLDTIMQTPTVTRALLLMQKRGLEEGRTGQLEGVLKAFPDSPVFGWGGSVKASYYVANYYGGVDNVIHNIFLDMFARYGLVGLFVYLSFMFMVFKRGNAIYRYSQQTKDFLLFIPVFSLGMLVFSGMFVPWLWKDLIWYNAIITIAIFEILRKENLILNG